MTAAPKISPQDQVSLDASGLDEDSLSAIRSILVEEDAPAPLALATRSKAAAPEAAKEAPLPRRKADGLPELGQPEPQVHADLPDKNKSAGKFSWLGRTFGGRVKTVKTAKATKATTVSKAAPKELSPAVAGIVDRVKAYRPKRSHIVLAAFGLLVLFRPWLVFGVIFLLGLIIAGLFLIAGYDGFWQGVMKASRWYTKMRPSRAQAVHEKLDQFAVRWDAVLDRFPEGTVDGLYLPDFGELATADARHDAALERRLAGLSQKEA